MNKREITILPTHVGCFICYFLILCFYNLPAGQSFSPPTVRPGNSRCRRWHTPRVEDFVSGRLLHGSDAMLPITILCARRKDVPRSELFPEKGSSYVPSGLTQEEYAKIKKKDNDKLSKLNFSMWGPRFLQGIAPQGDWMVQPNLWTAGFQRQTANGTAVNGKRNLPSLLFAFVRKSVPAYLIAYITIDVALASYTLLRQATALSLGSMLLMALRLVTFQQRHNIILLPFWKLLVLKVGSALLLVPPFQHLLEHANRKWLWSPRRTLVSSMGTLYAFLMFMTLMASLMYS